jgi:hypothetical protein
MVAIGVFAFGIVMNKHSTKHGSSRFAFGPQFSFVSESHITHEMGLGYVTTFADQLFAATK